MDAKHRLKPKDFQNLDYVAETIADQPHNFAGATVMAYHASTRGFILNEIFRRCSGRSMGELVKEVFEPYGAEIYCGTVDKVEKSGRVCTDFFENLQLMI